MAILMIIGILVLVVHNWLANRQQDSLYGVLRHEETSRGYTSHRIRYKRYAKFGVVYAVVR